MDSSTSGPIVGIGEILWDLFPKGKQLGGTVMNVAHHVHQMGPRAEIVSCVGDDALGQEVRQTLHRLGLGDRYVASDPTRPTGTVDVSISADGQPSYTIHHAVAWDGVPLTPDVLALARSAQVICFGTLAQRTERGRESVQTLVKTAPASALRLLDINLRKSFYEDVAYSLTIIKESLQLASVFKLNHEELALLAELLELPQDEDTFAQTVREQYNLQLVALTRGNRGSVLFTANGRDEHPGYPVAIVDTVGAGDAFTAALIVGLLRGLPLSQIHDVAAQIASYVCTQPGGTPPLPAPLARLLA